MLISIGGKFCHIHLYYQTPQFSICATCFESFWKKLYNGPPQFVITNMLYVGIFPKKIHSLTRTELAMKALGHNSVWLSIVKFRQNHIIHSHKYAFATTLAPTVETLKHSILVMLARRWAKFIATIEKYLIHNATCTNILVFYKSNNPRYKHVETTTPPKIVSSYIFHVLYMLTPIVSIT